MKDSVTMICDPMITEYGPVQPPILVAKELAKKGYSIKVVSTAISEDIRQRMESMNISVVDLGRKVPRGDPSLVWFKSWITEAFFSRNSKKTPLLDANVINFSNTVAVPSKAWYAQGPLTATLDLIKPFLPWRYKLVYDLTSHVLKHMDKRLIKRMAKISEKLIVNSRYLADIYTSLGVKVHDVIYPPLNCDKFKPSTFHPSEDYVLTYFGKETDFSVVKKVADLEVEIISFGSKSTVIPSAVSRHPHIKTVGRVSDAELVNLYSNALFVLYPFTAEPFGYVPVESMACGTPVLTFNRQGPSESIFDGVTGWLVNSNEEIVNFSLKLWKKGLSTKMRELCRKRAFFFEDRKIAGKWIDLLYNFDNSA